MSLITYFREKAAAKQELRQERETFRKMIDEIMEADLSQKSLPELLDLKDTLDPTKNETAKRYKTTSFIETERRPLRLRLARARISNAIELKSPDLITEIQRLKNEVIELQETLEPIVIHKGLLPLTRKL